MINFIKKKNDSIEKNQYFLYLNRIKKNNLNSIINNSNNNNIMALQKKDYEKIRQIKLRQNDSVIIKDINWLVYITKYFKKKYKEGSLWYKNIIDKVSEQDFIYETQFQSYAFFKDFEMKYKTKCLRIIEKEKEIEKYEDKEEELISKITRNSIIDISNRNSRIDLSGITDNFGGSFGEFKEDLDLIEEDSGIKSKKKLKEFIRIFKRHLNKKEHPINIIISIFCEQYSFVLENQVNLFLNNKNKNDLNFEIKIKSFSDEIVEDLKRFIIKIQTTIKLFYCKSINLEFFVEEKDELINLITTIIFQKGDIYKNIYSLFNMQFKKEVDDFEYKLHLIKDIKPIDLNIPNKLSLDENTSKEILKLKEEYKKEEGILDELNNNKEFIPQDGYIKGFHDKNKINGYNTVVKMLLGLKHTKSPFEKMMLIASMSMEITQCVDKYWNNMDNYLPSYYLSINADEFLSLFILVVIKAQFAELIIHEKIIQIFTTKTTKSSTIGYYNVTLNAAIEYIKNEANKELNKNNYNGKDGKNSASLISQYLFQSIGKNNNEDNNNDEFILIDSKGKDINSNINNIINTNSSINMFSSDIDLFNNNHKKNSFFNKKKEKNYLEIEEDLDEKNCELSIKNYEDDK